MKAERRHELQHNSLAAFLQRTPEMLRQHGAKILLAIIIILLGAILLRQRSRKAMEQLDQGWTYIASARLSLDRLSALPRFVETEAQLAGARKQLVDGVAQAVAPILDSDNRQIAAEAYLLRGDLDWTIANLPPLPAAATQPSLQISGTADEHLAKATEAYEKVLRVYPDQSMTVTSARFGLAAIAENKSEFDAAAKIYEEIKSDAKTIGVYKTLADIRIKTLAEIRKPLYLAPATKPTTAPVNVPTSGVEVPAAPSLAPAMK